jgi:hypothetical protein
VEGMAYAERSGFALGTTLLTGAAFLGGIIDVPGGGTMQGGSSGSRVLQRYRPETTKSRCPGRARPLPSPGGMVRGE